MFHCFNLWNIVFLYFWGFINCWMLNTRVRLDFWQCWKFFVLCIVFKALPRRAGVPCFSRFFLLFQKQGTKWRVLCLVFVYILTTSSWSLCHPPIPLCCNFFWKIGFFLQQQLLDYHLHRWNPLLLSLMMSWLLSKEPERAAVLVCCTS